jgi:N-acetyl-anhydromuramyl-L-alanine amidase AmpD
MRINDLRKELPKNPDPDRVWKKRDSKDIKGIAIHQSASDGTTWGIAKYHTDPTSDRDGDGIIESWERNHVSSKGAPAICYHYTIEKNGEINWCNDLDSIVWHAGTSKGNRDYIAICVIGNFSGPTYEGKEEPTDAQINSLKYLLDFLTVSDFLGLSKEDVVGHNDLKKSKENCPGTMLSIALETYKN